ncbi:unnamed protein product [Symbiodinium natans]|uniref:WLM domain-containing protein n=1 Tax=Symbiodinium natans TaxID=878477 RepID=A0A812RXI4_9DINO|nr:unnamed protein product [Symbiodinium natans]
MKALLLGAAFLIAAILVYDYFWTGFAGLRADHRSVREAWPDSTDAADERAYDMLKDIGRDPALSKLMQRHHLRTGCLKELGPHDPRYKYDRQATQFEVLEGYNDIMTLDGYGPSARGSAYIALRLRDPPGNQLLPRNRVVHTLLHELAHCRYDGSADPVKHMRADVRDPAEKQFRAFLSQLESDYKELRQAAQRTKAEPPQSRELQLHLTAAVSTASSAVAAARQIVTESCKTINSWQCAVAFLLMWLLRKLLRCRAGNFAKGQCVRTRALPAMHLNGIEGVLTSYHLWRGAWSLKRRNGATIMVRASNLEGIP